MLIFCLGTLILPYYRISQSLSSQNQTQLVRSADNNSNENNWPMFHDNLNHTGTTETTPKENNGPFWERTTNGSIFSSPIIVNGSVYVGSYDHKLYCYNADIGTLKWTFTTKGEIYSTPEFSSGCVYIGSKDGNIYCLNADVGSLVWNYSFGSDWSPSSPAILKGLLYL